MKSELLICNLATRPAAGERARLLLWEAARGGDHLPGGPPRVLRPAHCRRHLRRPSEESDAFFPFCKRSCPARELEGMR